MAQVIAIQRGALSMAHSTTTLVFTGPSTGTSTRVIVGYLGWTSNNATVYGYCNFSVLRSGASSPNYAMFAGTYPADAARTVSFSPHDTRTGWHGSAGSTTENSPILWNQSTAGLVGGTCLSTSGNGPNRAWFNSDILIGPSDAIYCTWFDNGGGSRTATVQYCFVTVNE